MVSPQTVNVQPLSIPQSPQVLPSPLFLWATAPASPSCQPQDTLLPPVQSVPKPLLTRHSPVPSLWPRSVALPFPLFPSNLLPGSRLQAPRSGLDCLSGLLSQRPALEPVSPPCRTDWSHTATHWRLQSQSSDSVSVQPFHPNLQALLGCFPRKPFLRVTEP